GQLVFERFQTLTQRLRFQFAEGGFPLLRKQRCDGFPGARLDKRIKVVERPIQHPRQFPSHRRLAGAHKADQNDDLCPASLTAVETAALMASCADSITETLLSRRRTSALGVTCEGAPLGWERPAQQECEVETRHCRILPRL